MTRPARRAARQSWSDALKVREGYWFAPKLFGYGATPVTWQGWLVTALFAAALATVLAWAPSLFVKIGVALPLTALFIWFAWTRTDGEWRWRWGPDWR